MKKNSPTLITVIPCYNEEEILDYTIEKIQELYNRLINDGLINSRSKVCFVNDGSKDSTKEIIKEVCNKENIFTGINLSRNFGHQGAILAGLFNTDADIYVTIDADLQDDYNSIELMVKKYLDGCEIVYGVRNKRNTDTVFKKYSALMFYKLMELMGVNIVYNHADFRLMSRRAIEELKKFKERNLFLRAVVPLLGFKSCNVYYDRTARLAGESKYPLKKMMAFAFDGITSFSVAPLRLVTIMGVFISLFSFIFILYGLNSYYKGDTISGWTSLFIALAFFNGIIVLSLGIIGEYIGKLMLEAKERPLYIIEDKIL